MMGKEQTVEAELKAKKPVRRKWQPRDKRVE